MSVKYITLRLNIEKEQQRRIWETLRDQRNKEKCSYSEVLVQALARDMERGIADGEDIVQNCAERITAAVENTLRSVLPHFLSGLIASGNGLSVTSAMTLPVQEESTDNGADNDTIPDEEIPWDYLGE